MIMIMVKYELRKKYNSEHKQQNQIISECNVAEPKLTVLLDV